MPTDVHLMQLLAATHETRAAKDRALGGLKRFSRSSRGRGLALYLYLTIYLALEWASQFHSFEFLDIALWNPSPAASLILLLTRGLTYTPLLFMAGLLSSVFVHHNPHSFAGTILSSALLAAGYAVLAFALRRAGFQLGRGTMQDIVVLLVLAPAGALLTAMLACGVIVLTGDLPQDRFLTALSHFWVGDTLGILVVVPAVAATLILRRDGLDLTRGGITADITVFGLGLGVALWCMFGLAHTNDHQFFYFLFLPVIWIAIRNGFAGAAFAVLVSQLALLVVTETVDYAANAFIGLQMLMLTLAATGHLLGASVSERRRSEARAKIQQAELARMARNTTAGAMGVALAHQISQPLSTVATHIHVALSRAKTGEAGSGEIVQSLQIATDEMRRAQDVLGHLREFISHGKAETAPVDLTALIIRLADILRAEAGRKQVRFSFDLGTVPPITADAIQIEQVVLNLVTNAVEAAAERQDGQGRVLVQTMDRDGAARILVEDNGGGISEEVAERLYEPFVSTKESGMGLGLALSRQIVALHGGRMWWETVQPEGTRFIVELPVARGNRE
jgi:two-component system, LuxR family, sensor kinase FixL